VINVLSQNMPRKRHKKRPKNSRSVPALHLPMKNNPFGRA